MKDKHAKLCNQKKYWGQVADVANEIMKRYADRLKIIFAEYSNRPLYDDQMMIMSFKALLSFAKKYELLPHLITRLKLTETYNVISRISKLVSNLNLFVVICL